MWQVVSGIVTPLKALMVCKGVKREGVLVDREAQAGTGSPTKGGER